MTLIFRNQVSKSRLMGLAVLLFSTTLILAGCGRESDSAGETQIPPEAGIAAYVVLDESLQQLKDDFNANKDKVRLLFIVGDTCGICLRGLADFSDAFIAGAQDDDRLLTMVLHVPVMGAKEKDVPASMQLLDGPRIKHYWDGTGKSGIHFGDTLDTDGVYAWDVWLAYGSEAQWLETVPPKPAFWMHQLAPLPDELKLDATLFAEKTLTLMNTIKAGSFNTSADGQRGLSADAVMISNVMQPIGVAIQQHLLGRGGFHNLKLITSITRKGIITTASESTGLETIQDRDQGLSRSYVNSNQPLASDIEALLNQSWQMHGPLFRWAHRGHQVHKDGMLKLGSSLTWRLTVTLSNGSRQVVHVDSHTGDIVLTTLINTNGETLLSVYARDFREVNGFRFPFEIEYVDADGNSIAKEIYTEINVVTEDFSAAQSAVTHYLH